MVSRPILPRAPATMTFVTLNSLPRSRARESVADPSRPTTVPQGTNVSVDRLRSSSILRFLGIQSVRGRQIVVRPGSPRRCSQMSALARRRESWKPPFSSRARYSSSVRSWPPGTTSMTRSGSLPKSGFITCADHRLDDQEGDPLADGVSAVCQDPEALFLVPVMDDVGQDVGIPAGGMASKKLPGTTRQRSASPAIVAFAPPPRRHGEDRTGPLASAGMRFRMVSAGSRRRRRRRRACRRSRNRTPQPSGWLGSVETDHRRVKVGRSLGTCARKSKTPWPCASPCRSGRSARSRGIRPRLATRIAGESDDGSVRRRGHRTAARRRAA